MCGFTFRKSNLLKGQMGLLRHRGPDEQSYFVGTDYELEFSRLTITGTIDGKVPVYSTNREWLVAFNGEIYNFKSLIETHCLPFTNSDTKVIADGLEKHGLGFLENLRGMYAGIAINSKTKATYVFRDPLGEKPLFYSSMDEHLVIASEFTALLKHLDRPLKLNPKAISDYFRFGYVEEPDTFDSEIFALKRGAVFRVTDDYKFVQEMVLLGYNEVETSLDLTELLRLLNMEVSFSTVPTGLALSAGVDSTSLLYAMSKYRDAEFVPIVVNIDREGLSKEASAAINSCETLGIQPHILQSTPDSLLFQNLNALAIANDQPHSDPSGLSYLSIFQSAQALGLKVILLGHGPDELFWGYPWFNSQLLKMDKRVFPRQSGVRDYWKTPAANSRLLRYFSGNHASKSQSFSTDPYLLSNNPWEKYRAEMVHSYLSSNGLRQSDRLAMASGVEPRTPYADSRLYGWAQNRSIKSSSAFDKSEFRNAVELGPLESSRWRTKEGFNSPMGQWFQNPAIRDLAGDTLSVVLQSHLDWRLKPRFSWLSPSEKYRITMLGIWLSKFN